LAVGVALARALEAAGFAGIERKWPNDLIHDEAKVGGILVELSGDALGPSLAIVGVGLNVRLPASVRRGIGRPVTDLVAVGGQPPLDRNLLLARFVAEMVTVLEGYAEAGFAPLRGAWQRRHAYQGKPVQVVLPDGGKVRGVVVGVDQTGALVLDSGARRLRFVSGEVSLRRS
jgi:BirA family biotin operon repressor/biotin-[acetyl-CoA-carboxylase] ligase